MCECGQADQTPDHVLQSCPKHVETRQLTWPQGADLATKLWGSAEDLYRTAAFVASTGLKISPARLSIAETEEEMHRTTQIFTKHMTKERDREREGTDRQTETDRLTD